MTLDTTMIDKANEQLEQLKEAMMESDSRGMSAYEVDFVTNTMPSPEPTQFKCEEIAAIHYRMTQKGLLDACTYNQRTA